MKRHSSALSRALPTRHRPALSTLPLGLATASLILAGPLAAHAVSLIVDPAYGNTPYTLSSSASYSTFTVADAGTASLTMSGSPVVNAVFISVAAQVNGNGSFVMNGGALNTVSGSGGYFYVGETGTGSFTLNGGTVTAAEGIAIAVRKTGNINSNGTFTLNGGTVSTSSITSGSGTANFVFNGGTLQASANSINFLQGLNTSVQTGGAIVDSNGNDITITQALTHDIAAAGTDGGLNKKGAGTLTLTGTNTYTGATTLTGGILSVATLPDGGTASPIGQTSNAAANLVFNGGTLQYTGAAQATNRLFTLGASGGTLDASGSGLLNLNNTGTIAFAGTAATRSLGLAGTGTGSLAAVIPDNGSEKTAVTKSDSGTWTLTGTNTYTGATTLSSGILSVTTLANGGTASNIGQSTNAAANLVFNGGTLKYTGGAQNTNRLFTLGAGGGTLDNSGSGALNFNNTGTIAIAGTATTRTLLLAGTGTGSLAAIIPDNGSEKTAVTKIGAGTWRLSGVNTLTGGVTLFGGVLELENSGAGNVLPVNSPIQINNGTLRLVGNGYNAFLTPNLTVSATGLVTASGTTNNAHTLGTTLLQGGTLSSTTPGPGGYAQFVLGPSYTLTANGDVPSTINSDTFQVDSGSIISVGTGTGGAPSLLTISSQIQNTANVTTPTPFSKTGAGKLILSGANIYTGTTTIGGGTLQLGAGGTTGSLSTSSAITNNATLAFNRSNALNQSTDFGTISGSGSVQQIGTGTTTLTAANTYTGTTGASSGTLVVNGTLANTTVVSASLSGRIQLGAANRINDSAALNLGGGTFDTGGFSETVGALTLSSGVASTFDLGSGTSILHLADSSAQSWSGTLTIQNWSGSTLGGGTDRLFFGSSAAGLTPSQIAAITFLNPLGFPSGSYSSAILSSGELVAVAVPEPSTPAALVGGLTLLLALQRPRREKSSRI